MLETVMGQKSCNSESNLSYDKLISFVSKDTCGVFCVTDTGGVCL